MANGRTDRPGKHRTRGHILADLSANRFEWHALACGFSVERIQHDYGYDLALFTYDRQGRIENGMIWVQLKATDHARLNRLRNAVVVRVERAHLLFWLREIDPVMLVVYDAAKDQAYWLHVQGEVKGGRIFRLLRTQATVSMLVPTANVLDRESIQAFARLKAVGRRRLKKEQSRD